MNSSDTSRCPSCNSDIHQWQRFCDKCGHKFNQTTAKESLCTGKIDDSPCYNVITSRIKFCGNCGTQNKSYIADTDIRKTNTRDSTLHSEQDADQQDKWEPYTIDINIAEDSTTKVSGDIDKNDNVLNENDGDTQTNLDPPEMKNDSTTKVSGDIKKNGNVPNENNGDTQTNLDPQEMKNDSTTKVSGDIKKNGNVPNETDGDTQTNLDPQEMKNDSTTKVSGDIKKNGNVPNENDGDTQTNLDPQEMNNESTIKVSEDIKKNGNVPNEHDGDKQTNLDPQEMKNDSTSKVSGDIKKNGNVPNENDGYTQTNLDPQEMKNASTTKVSGDIKKNGNVLKENDGDTQTNLDPHEMKNDSTSKLSEDIEKNDNVLNENDGDTKNNLDPQQIENDITLNEFFAQLKRDGISETTTYIRQKLNEVKTRILKFAVIGRSAVGKSSFINMMLDLQPGNKCYAETGAGDTTKNKYAYQHPKNENITFWDMPGFGTMEMTIEKFSSEFGFELNTFDYFFIFIDTVIMEADLWLVDKIKGFGTPYCFMRSKLDEDIQKGRTKEEIRQKLEKSIQESEKVKGSALFLISNEKAYLHTGDFRQLFSHIIKHLPLAKAESLSFFLPILTPEVIEDKFQTLQNRIIYIALTAGGISAIPIPFLDIGVNILIIGREINYYHKVFLLDKNMAQNVPGIKHKKISSHDIQKTLMTALKAVTNVATVGTLIMSQADVLLPGVGSVAAGGAALEYARRYLNKTLIEMKEDANSVYEHYSIK